eukprot:2847831-Pyramimonas_sp.AAC.1
MSQHLEHTPRVESSWRSEDRFRPVSCSPWPLACAYASTAAAPIGSRSIGQPPGLQWQAAPQQPVEMQRVMRPARLGRAESPSHCFGVWPAGKMRPQHSAECQIGSRPCSRTRTQRVAPQEQAAVAPDCATGRSHKIRRSA